MKWISPLGEEHWDWKTVCFTVFFLMPALFCLGLVICVVIGLLVVYTFPS